MDETDLRYKTLKDFSRILSFFEAEGGERKRVSDISNALRMLPSKVSRMLKTLEADGLVERDPRTGRYGIGARFFQLGLLYLLKHPLRRVILPHLEQTAKDLGLLSAWGIFASGRAIIVDRIRSDSGPPIHLIGSDVPLHSSSYGKLFLAHLSEEDEERIVKSLPFVRLTSRSICDADALRKELCRVRGKGYAVDEGETHDGMVGIAAPIFDDSGELVAALTVSGKSQEFSTDRASEVQYLTEKALFISRQLGYGPHKQVVAL